MTTLVKFGGNISLEELICTIFLRTTLTFLGAFLLWKGIDFIFNNYIRRQIKRSQISSNIDYTLPEAIPEKNESVGKL